MTDDPIAEQIAELRREIRALKAQRVGYVTAPVTAVDAGTSTFTVTPPAQQDGAASSLTGLSSPPHFLPDVGDEVTLAVSGARPIYQPARIAQAAVGGTELSADAIDGKVITGAIVQTAADGLPRMKMYETVSNGTAIGMLGLEYGLSADGYSNGWLQAVGDPVGGLRVDLYTGQKDATPGPEFQMFLDSNDKATAYLNAPDGFYVNGQPWAQQRGWTFQRTSGNASDPFSPGSMTSLIAGTVGAAPAGGYFLNIIVGMSAVGATQGNLRILANAANQSEDMRVDLNTDVRPVNFSTTYTHTGGDLSVTFQFQTASQNGVIWTNGSRINVVYLGPSS